MSKRDFYQILGVGRDANETELKKAYRKLAMQYHPDKNPGDDEAEEMFKEAAEAYDVLKDQEKRQIYDQFGHEGLKGRGFGGGPGGFDDIFSSFSDIFDGFFGGGGGRSRSTGADLRLDLKLKFEEAAFGIQKVVNINKRESCGTCRGSGSKPGTSPQVCGTCRGSGQYIQQQGFFSIKATCPACNGAGQKIVSPCSDCRGQGSVLKPKEISVNVPAGVDNGSRLRLRGEGEGGPNGEPPGDIYVIIHMQPHEFFHREEYDLYCRLPISFSQAALGAEIEVPLLEEGKTKVISLPQGTQSGNTYRIPGVGIPHIQGRGRGDQVLQIVIETPKKLTKKQKELFQELAEIDGKAVKSKHMGFFEKLMS
jgi:molecular chaperone DnaJ